MTEWTEERALAELAAIYRSATRGTGRPPKAPFRSKSVPGWAYFPADGIVVREAPEETPP